MTTSRAIRKRRLTPGKNTRPDAARPLRVLVTAGPTYEPIDDVRFIGNRSSGAMGIAIADQAAGAGAQCTLLLGPTALAPTHSSVRVLRFRTTADLQALLNQQFPHCDVLVMAAAVADYRLPASSNGALPAKLPRSRKGLTLRLEATPDLVASIAKRRSPNQLIVGFALEPEATMKERAAAKLARKGLDLIVANPLETMDSPSIRATVISPSGVVSAQNKPESKRSFARKLVRLVREHYRAANLT